MRRHLARRSRPVATAALVAVLALACSPGAEETADDAPSAAAPLPAGGAAPSEAAAPAPSEPPAPATPDESEPAPATPDESEPDPAATTGAASDSASDTASGPVAPEPSDEVAAAPAPAAEEFCSAVDEFGGAFLGTLGEGPPSPERLEEALSVAVDASVRAAEAAPSPELASYFETGSANLQAVQEAYAAAGYDLTAIDPTTLPRVMDPPSRAGLEDVAAQLEATCPGSALPQSGG